MVEVGVDVARDASGRLRPPSRWHRARPDLAPADAQPAERAEPPMTTWARPWCLVDFGAGWTSGASMRQAFTL